MHANYLCESECVCVCVYVRERTFSNWIGFILKPGGSFLWHISNFMTNSLMTATSSIDAVERLVAFSSVTIFTSFLGWKSGTITLPIASANLLGDLTQSGIGMPNVSARRIDAAMMK